MCSGGTHPRSRNICVYLTCNLVTHSFKDHTAFRILIHSFPVTVPRQTVFTESATHPIYLPLSETLHHIFELHLRLEDKNNCLIELGGQPVGITLHIRHVFSFYTDWDE